MQLQIYMLSILNKLLGVLSEVNKMDSNIKESEVNKVIMDNYQEGYEYGFQKGWDFAKKLFTPYYSNLSDERHIDILKNIFQNKDITGPNYVLDHYCMEEIRNKIEEFETEIANLEIGDEFQTLSGQYGLIIEFDKQNPNLINYIGLGGSTERFFYGAIDKYIIRKIKGESEKFLKIYLKNKLTSKEENKEEAYWIPKRNDDGNVYLTCSQCDNITYETRYTAGRVLFPNYCWECGKKMTNGGKEVVEIMEGDKNNE